MGKLMTELKEISKLAWRALVDAERVIETIDPEHDVEAISLAELRKRISDVSLALFYALNLSQDEIERLT